MPTYREQVLADGAVAYWRLDEASGNALSQVGNFPGTVTGGVTRGQPGSLSDGNKAMLFDGVDDKITGTAIPIPGVWSVEGWIKSTDVDSCVFSNRTGVAGGFTIQMANGQLGIWTDGVTNATLIGVRFVADNTWHHLIVTFDGTTIRGYVDGVIDNSKTGITGFPATNLPWNIGTDPLNSVLWFTGLLDEVAIYPTALTPQQIAEHYALRYGQRTYQEFVIADGAVAYWKLDESSGTVAKSQVGSYDGTISGGVTLGQPGAINGYTAMVFDGSTGKIVAPSLTLPVMTTIEAWVNYIADGTIQPIFTCGSAESPTFYIATNGQVVLYDSVPNASVQGNLILSVGSWHQLVCVLNGSTATFYVNGVLDIERTYARPAVSGGVVQIGYDPAFGGAPNGFYKGVLDEVAIYPTALTLQQIAAHYQARIAWPDLPYAPTVPADVYPAGSLSNRWLPLTPSDVIDAPFGKLWIGGAGTLAAVGADGRIVNFTGVRAGTMLRLAGRRINATNTTATAILALRTQ